MARGSGAAHSAAKPKIKSDPAKLSHQLQTDGTYNYTYESEGNVTRRTLIATGAVTDYTWDHRNRLVTVTEKVSASGTTTKKTEYVYDAFDQRVAKRHDADGNGSWDKYEAFVWADGHEVLRFLDSDGQGATQSFRVANRYLYADAVDQLISDEQYTGNTGPLVNATTGNATAGNTLWSLTDHLGSVRDVVDNSGVVRQHVVFDSFGKRFREVDYDTAGTQIAETNAAAIDELFGYTGRDWDEDVGLQYNRARWYDPGTGRWLSQDPIGFAAGDANLYRYVQNSVTGATDPSGEAKRRVTPEGVAAAGGGHHVVPFQRWAEKHLPVSVQHVFNQVIPHNVDHSYNQAHIAYNKRVGDLFDTWLSKFQDVSKVTPEQAQAFWNCIGTATTHI